MKIGSPTADTPTPGTRWTTLSDKGRLAWASETLAENGWSGTFEAVRAEKNGHVILRLQLPLDASERGEMLRLAERELKDSIDAGLTIWLNPAQDRNRPRQLRGVKVL